MEDTYGETLYRCSQGIINMDDTFGKTGVMTAVRWGYLQSVLEMYMIEGVNFDIMNLG